MAWELDGRRSIYGQLLEEIRLRIITGMYPPGGRLPSVRDLAEEAGVNPNTMQRALTELERTGVIYSVRTSGRFVTEDTGMIRSMKTEEARSCVEEFIGRMRALRIEDSEILPMVVDAVGGVPALPDSKTGTEAG